MTTTTRQHRLDFGPLGGGALDLVNRDGSTGPFWFKTLANGFDLGSGEATKVIIASLMRDGDKSKITRRGNRTITFTVQVKGYTTGALSAGAAALDAQCEGGNFLAWTPPDGLGETTVFVVVNSVKRIQFDGAGEARDGVKVRTFTLELECKPFGRSVDLETQTFAPTGVAPTVVDPCTSAANWGLVNAVEGGYAHHSTVGTNSIEVFDPGMFGFTWSGAKPTTDYIALDLFGVTPSGWGPLTIKRPDTVGQQGPEAVEAVMVGSDVHTRYWFTNPGGVDPYAFWFPYWDHSAPTPSLLYVSSLSEADAVGAAGVAAVNTIGSARAEGAITVTRATAIDYLFVYIDPVLITHTFSPAVRATWGAAPAATYVVFAKNWGTTGDVLELTFTDTAGRVQTARTLLSDDMPTYRPIGEVYLGGFQNGLIGAQTLAAKKNGAPDLVPTDIRIYRKSPYASLVYLDGFGGVNEVVIETPSLDSDTGAVYADGVAVWDKVVEWSTLTINPRLTAAYIETDDQSAHPPTSLISYYPNWLDFAA
jgi:hypothetical protein